MEKSCQEKRAGNKSKWEGENQYTKNEIKQENDVWKGEKEKVTTEDFNKEQEWKERKVG